ncbi:ABC transporter permease [candidate division WOR-3 bacterium]|nr:ABC transporter permease [candidate division WOR-3 bacterium]
MYLVFSLLGFILVLFIGVPVLKALFGTPVDSMRSSLSEKSVYFSILMTVFSAAFASLIGIIFGVPLAYILARKNFFGKRLVESLIDIPVVIPHSAAGIALLFVFGRNFLTGKLFNLIGVSFYNSIPGVIIAMLFVSIPFLVNSAREGFESVDEKLEKVARSLGASPWRTFLTISMPLASRSILAGSIMMWARGASEFGAVLILAYNVNFFGNYVRVAPILVAERFNSFGLEYAKPVTAIVILISLVVFVVLRMFTAKEKKHD